MITEQSDICSFVDDNTLNSCGEKLTEIEENLLPNQPKNCLP